MKKITMPYKDRKGQRPNAPELQQILLESPTSQPPTNPYYYETTSRGPPPAYSDLSAQAASVEPSSSRNMSRAEYSRFQPEGDHIPRVVPTQVVVQQPTVIRHDRRNDLYYRKVRRYNVEMLLMAIVVIFTSSYAYELYNRRTCIDNFVVHKPSPTVEIKIRDVRETHLQIVFFSGVIVILSLLKCCMGYGKTHSCYLFIMGLICFLMTLCTGYLAYLSFYTTCSMKLGELGSNLTKTLLSKITDQLPSPDRGFFGESNVFDFIEQDRYGVFIFFINVFNFGAFLSGFISAVSLC